MFSQGERPEVLRREECQRKCRNLARRVPKNPKRPGFTPSWRIIHTVGLREKSDKETRGCKFFQGSRVGLLFADSLGSGLHHGSTWPAGTPPEWRRHLQSSCRWAALCQPAHRVGRLDTGFHNQISSGVKRWKKAEEPRKPHGKRSVLPQNVHRRVMTFPGFYTRETRPYVHRKTCTQAL